VNEARQGLGAARGICVALGRGQRIRRGAYQVQAGSARRKKPAPEGYVEDLNQRGEPAGKVREGTKILLRVKNSSFQLGGGSHVGLKTKVQ